VTTACCLPCHTGGRVGHADPTRRAVKVLVDASLPHEPFNSYVREGTVGKKIEEALQAIHPEVI
jgi:hypothetical protein